MKTPVSDDSISASTFRVFQADQPVAFEQCLTPDALTAASLRYRSGHCRQAPARVDVRARSEGYLGSGQLRTKSVFGVTL